MYRTGIGYDVHRLVEGRRLIIGGVEIPYKLGLLGHSDADVLLHAITDALLGAAALGDIGNMFPDDDPDFKDADSAILLRSAWTRVTGKGYRLSNLDTIIIAEKPKFASHIAIIRQSIAGILDVELERVGVKATTNEKLGSIGAGKAIAAWSVCMLEK